MNFTNNILKFYKTSSKKESIETIDENRFISLIEDNKVALYRLAKSIVKDDFEVEDIISETILKAYGNLHKLKSAASFKPWLMKILVNECYSAIRKSSRIELKEDMEVLNLRYEDNTEGYLISLISNMDEDSRVILTLFYYEDMTIKDIGQVLNISQGTVKSRLSRAKAKLKTILENQ